MSTKEKQDVSSLVEQDLALKVYIDSLLIEPAVEVETQTETNTETNTETLVENETKPTLTETDPSSEVDLQQEVAVEEQQAAQTPDHSDDVQTPDQPFECLMFKVAGGLNLSVPLARLNGILQWQGECTHLPGHADWFLGLVSNRGHQVKVVDIASFVIPENHQAREGLSGERQFKHLILIDDGHYGLACDDLGDVLKISPDNVRWRADRANRPWLAGTLIDKMCALIDVDQFIAKLKEGIRLDDI